MRTTRRRALARTADPRGHWFLVAVGLAMLIGALTLHGLATQEVGRTPERALVGSLTPGLDELRAGGPLVNAGGAVPGSARARPGTIALTFDDGPDPVWTPKILSVLRRHKAKATFFVIGARAARHPELIRRILADGHEIGVHTYTHADLAAVPAWRAATELALTQRALAGAAGLNTRLVRLPYTTTPRAVDAPQFDAMRRAAAGGHLIALADLDPQDWALPGVRAIVAAATPSRGQGAVVLLQDAGGDRGQTVAAVDRLLSAVRARGYEAVTLTRATGLPGAHLPATGADRFSGKVLGLAQRASQAVAYLLGWALAAAGLLTLARLLVFFVLARAHARRARQDREAYADPLLPPPVTVIVPAYQEAAGIAATVRSIAATDYIGVLEVLVVDDGSTDGTAAAARSARLPNVRVLRRPNGGKPAALTTGIERARHDILIMVDGDTVLGPATIGALVRRLADPEVGAVSGNTKVGNRGGVLGRLQHIEYVIGFNLDRRAFELLGCMTTVPGAIGAFRRSALVAAGGISADTLAEDTDLTMAIRRAGLKVVYEEKAHAWTEAPATPRRLWRQRYRWCYGTLQAMWKHKAALLDRDPYGRRCLSYLALFQVLLPLLAPAVDVLAAYQILVGEPLPVVAIWAGFVVVQALTGWYALRLDGERASALWVLPLQQLLYRQLMYLVVIQSLATAVLGARLKWHVIGRDGTFGKNLENLSGTVEPMSEKAASNR